MMKITILAAALLLSQAVYAADCPSRPGEPVLSLAQVMYHWGKASRVVGSVGLKGMNDEKSVTPAELTEAHQVVDTARACVKLIIAVTPADLNLLPSKFPQMSPADQQLYLSRFKELAQLFSDTLDQLGLLCEALLKTPSKADFTKMRDLERELVEIANRAHGSL
jgi:hypothetical protein